MICTYISSVQDADVAYNHTKKICTVTDSYSAHCHDRCEMIFFISGDVSYNAEGRSYKLSYGDVILSRPSVIHAIVPEKNTTYERYDVILDQKLLPGGIWEKLKNGKDVYRCRSNERIFDLFSKLDDYYLRFSDEEYARLVFNISEEILFNLSLMNDEEEPARVNPLLDKALSYIADNLTRISGVEEISHALYVTKSHLHHIFAEHLQITPAKYIVSKRLLLAQKRIRRGERPTTVFSKCGFADYATFFRNYKKYFGYSPAEEGKVRPANQTLS